MHAAFSADPNGVTLHDGHWDLLGGQWRQSGAVRFADTIAIDGAVDADAVDGAALTAALQRLVGDAVAPPHLAGAVRSTPPPRARWASRCSARSPSPWRRAPRMAKTAVTRR